MRTLFILATLHEMLTGPGRFRFVLQPLVALFLGLRDAKLDVAAGRPPFLLSLLTRHHEQNLGKQALRQIAIPLLIATVLDAVLQLIITSRIRVWQAVVTGAVLIAFPYSAGRGLFNRALRNRAPHRREA